MERAKKEMEHTLGELPDKDLAYLREGSPGFDDYVTAVEWAGPRTVSSSRRSGAASPR